MYLSEPQEKPLDWAFRRKHKTHFADRQACQSAPRTNTPGLYDGSAEARAILGPTFEGDITQEGADIRRHALRYLKGMDSIETSFAKDFFGDEDVLV